jgi:DNA-binding IscR family transcriptional regulator
MLSREPAGIGMREILEAVEGPMALKQCLLWSGHCSESEPCPLHNRLKPFRSQLDQMLNEVTLADYVEVSLNANPPATEDSGAS